MEIRLLPFCAAVALIDGDITPETYERKRFLDPDVNELMNKITIELNSNFTAAAPEDRNCRMTAQLPLQRKIVTERCQTQAMSERRIPQRQLEKKFNKMSTGILSETSRSKLIDLIWHLEEVDRVDELVSLTGI